MAVIYLAKKQKRWQLGVDYTQKKGRPMLDGPEKFLGEDA